MSKLLPADRRERDPTRPEVWNFRDHKTWRGTVWALVEDFADSHIRDAFLRAPPKYVVGDDLGWLDNLVREVHGHVLDSKALVAERLCQKYVAIRAVHGTRTIDINSFYENGLIPLDLNQQHKRAREIFLSGAFPELSEENLRTAIASFGDHQREGRVYFEANEDFLIDLAGHYLLYGSEYLLGLAGHLGYARKYQRVLKLHGAPTLFVCDVPLSMLSPGTLLEFAGEALETLFQELLDGESFIRDRYRGAGFCIRQRLPPECIVGHCHPSVKRDPIGR